MIYVTSDTHFYHKNIVRKLSTWGDGSTMRDFDSVEHMNDTIVLNINKRVKEDDHLICLGDWSFGNVKNIKTVRDRINCNNIDIILGNHDYHIKKVQNEYNVFTNVDKYKEITIKKIKIILFHFPIFSWNYMDQGAIHLHGHCHYNNSKKKTNGPRSMDVGLDGNEMQVYSIDEIFELLLHENKRQEGHH
jgi:calcineurin-like phosphoesterase family protein